MASRSTSRLHAGTLEQAVKRHGALMVQQAKALRRATNKPTKVQYTGVQVLAQCTNDLFYSNSRDRALAIAKAINQDVLEVDALGIDFIQFDEFTWPYFFEDWGIEAFNVAVEGVKNAKIIVHVCWGNWGWHPRLLSRRHRQGPARSSISPSARPMPRRPPRPARWCRKLTGRISTC